MLREAEKGGVSVMDHLSPGVDALVELEHKTIVQKYGEGYHSDHEAYAVLKEEIEEAHEQLVCVETHLDNIWEAIREDGHQFIGKNVLRIEHYAKQLAAEAVQVAAVCRRMRDEEGDA